MQSTGETPKKSIFRVLFLAAAATLILTEGTSCTSKPKSGEPFALFKPLYPSAEFLSWKRIEIEKISDPRWKISIEPTQALDPIRIQTFLRSLSTLTPVSVQTDRGFSDHRLDPPEWTVSIQSQGAAGLETWKLQIGEEGGRLEADGSGVSRWARVDSHPHPILLRGAFVEILNQIPSDRFFQRTKLFSDRLEEIHLGKKRVVRNAANESLFQALEQTRFMAEVLDAEQKRIQAQAKLLLKFKPAPSSLRLYAESGRLYAVVETSVFELYPESLRIFNRITATDLRP
ncbi:MAG: hypothetical protein JNL01_04535 [Bdellovibrionales bacterium]|nr:hypothetical protein [Bdellovibrionales bacterium]